MEQNKPNVILIVIDTLRKDYAKPLESILRKYGFVSYDRCIAPAPWTIPSHASILTGLYPSLHGIHSTSKRKVPDLKYKSFKISLQNELKIRGYKTFLFSANTFITPYFGFKDFDFFVDLWILKNNFINFLDEKEKKYILNLKNSLRENNNRFLRLKLALELIRRKKLKLFMKKSFNFILRWGYLYYMGFLKKWPKEKGISIFLNKIKKMNWNEGPYFIFVNLMEVHEPYDIRDNYGIKETLRGHVTDEAIKLWRKKYPKFTYYVFDKINILLNNIHREILDNSLIIITSDHGQLLGEENRLGHGVFLDNVLLEIPLFIKFPSYVEKIRPNFIDNKFISLIKIKHLILNIIDSKPLTDNILYSPYVLAESFGIFDSRNYFSPKEWERIKHLDNYKIAIFWKDLKAVFSTAQWTFEKIENLTNRKTISKEDMRIIKAIIASHLLKVMKFKKLRIIN